MMDFTDPGDQNDRDKPRRRGLPAAKNVDQETLFGAATPAPASSGPPTRANDPETSRVAAKRAADNMTEKQLAVLSMFHLHGEMNDEELCERYDALREKLNGDALAMVPQQTHSGIRSRRAELTADALKFLEFAGYKSRMTTGGEGRVHRIRSDAPVPASMNHLRTGNR